jgi:hypothetical protein
MKAACHITDFTTELRDSPFQIGTGHDDEGLTLREAGTGGMSREVEQAINHFGRNEGSRKIADHPSFEHDILEFHGRLLSLPGNL